MLPPLFTVGSYFFLPKTPYRAIVTKRASIWRLNMITKIAAQAYFGYYYF